DLLGPRADRFPWREHARAPPRRAGALRLGSAPLLPAWLRGCWAPAREAAWPATCRRQHSCARRRSRLRPRLSRPLEAEQRRLIGENDIGFPDADTYDAAIRPDTHGNAIIMFDYSSPHDWPSVAVTGALGPISGEQGGDFLGPFTLAQGT